MKKSQKITALQQRIAELESILNTEIYVKNSLQDFIIESGTSNIYYDEFRYKYNSQNFERFKETSLFPAWKEKRKEVLFNEEIKAITTTKNTANNG